ncbi:hypothetical protein DCCM_4690 [Desulfocucumis palustris]|uniref:GGDEF domain-containing protein n=1 Tax=Desulfocucumis palustris TaxID=1898651 RepID=A0A2L2XNL8_9FIRM|nr:sensor domain-containing diguanylate cyclase [Desulfocucumis palustris]GBF35561.1 hypothetical protein DCCM_4690 [Desulfocucumis palustris]
MKSGRGFLHILYVWLVILSGYWLLFYYFSAVDLDKITEYLLMIGLGILSEWLVVSFPLGRLSGGFSIVMACMLIYGPETCAWIGALAYLIARGVANRGDPLPTTLFNSSQQVLAVMGASYLCSLLPLVKLQASSQERLDLTYGAGMAAFVLFYFVINHGLVYIYAYPRKPRQRAMPWQDALRWDGLTYLITAPFGIIMALLYFRMGMATAVLLFVPLLVVQFVLRMYVHVELANRELRAMYEISRRLGGKLVAKEIPGLLLQEARRAMSFHCGVVYLQSDNPGVYKAEAVYGQFSKQMKKTVVYAGESFFGFVVTNREPEIIYDSRADFRVKGDPGMPQVYRSMVLVPLTAEGSVVGLLVLGEKRPMAYGEHHLQTLAVIVGVLSVALNNSLLERRIDYLEKIDTQTGLYNRGCFYQLCLDYFGDEPGKPETGALVITGVDYMDQLNRRYGYRAGDWVLQKVARVIHEMKPEGSQAGRYGGDQFILLLPGMNEEEAFVLAEDIRQAVGESRLPEGLPGNIRISCGVAVFPGDGDNTDKLLELCEKSLHRAKRTGKDRVVCASQL